MFLLLALLLPEARAFCGTYVGPAGSALENGISQVVTARAGDRITLTLASDVFGDTSVFGLLVPVPEALGAEDVRLADVSLFAQLDAWSAPRVVSYDCPSYESDADSDTDTDSDSDADFDTDASGVTVEAQFEVGDYDITVLAATGAGGLTDWLGGNGFEIPAATAPILQEYIDAGQHFLAARVDLDTLPEGGLLSPLQLSYTSEMWSLPIRLGTTVSPGEQEVVIYALSTGRDGFTAIANYAEGTPEDDCMLPEAVDAGDFYASELDAVYGAGAMWVQEYAWAPSWCDPCAAQPPDPELIADAGGDINGYVTRLHLRYAPEQVNQDVVLYSTGSTAVDQVRLIQYDHRLEATYPVCGVGFVADPGTCDEGTTGETGETPGGTTDDPALDDPKRPAATACGCGLGPTASGWFAGVGLLVIAARRRR